MMTTICILLHLIHNCVVLANSMACHLCMVHSGFWDPTRRLYVCGQACHKHACRGGSSLAEPTAIRNRVARDTGSGAKRVPSPAAKVTRTMYCAPPRRSHNGSPLPLLVPLLSARIGAGCSLKAGVQ